MKFFQFVLSSRTFLDPLNFNLHIFDPSRDVLICRFTLFLTKKQLKHMELHDLG